MIVLVIMIPLALILGFSFVLSFIISMKSGQYDDLETPAHRILKEESQWKETL